MSDQMDFHGTVERSDRSEHDQTDNRDRTTTAPEIPGQGGSQSRTGGSPQDDSPRVAEARRLDAEDARRGSPADAGSFGDTRGQAQADVQPGPDQTDDEYTHYVHLADGRVIKHNLTEPLSNHYEEGEGDDVTRTQIIGVYPR